MEIFGLGNKNDSAWIEWVHEGSKDAETHEEKLRNIELATTSKHCARCMNIGGCWFLNSKMPMQPLHPNCHCETKKIAKPIPNVTMFAECPTAKIKNYIFVNPAKKRFFESNGYGIMQADFIQKEIERQAVQKYAKGEYRLGTLDDHGQRITILTELSLYGKKPIIFLSGWIVYAYGRIVNTTPMASGDMKKIEKFREDINNEGI